MERRNWVNKGAIASLSAVILSLLVAIAMSAVSAVGFAPIKAMEKSSGDFTYRVAVAFFGTDGWSDSKEHRHIDPIVFLDIDEAGCEMLAADPWDCRTNGVVHHEVLLFVASGLAESEAKAIVFDTRLPDDHWDVEPDQQTELFSAWQKIPSVLIAAMPGAPGRDNVFFARDDAVTGAQFMTFAPAVLFDNSDYSDGIVRNLDRSVLTQFASDGSLETRATIAFALLDKLGQTYERDEEEPIFFSLASTIDNSASYGNGWERRALSRLIIEEKGRPKALQTAGLDRQIVLVGSSAAAAGDVHLTPLGTMAGPEILANIIRDVQMFPDRPDIGWLDKLTWKLVSLIPAMLILVMTEFSSAYLGFRSKTKGWNRTRYFALQVVLWTMAVSLAIVTTSYLSLYGLLANGSYELSGDLILPIIALFFEEFVRTSSRFILWFETRLAALVEGI